MSLVNVKVTPRAKRNAVTERDGRIVVHVTAPADDGKANNAVIQLLAEHWKLSKSQLSIVRGVTSRLKVIRRP